MLVEIELMCMFFILCLVNLNLARKETLRSNKLYQQSVSICIAA